MFFHKQELQHKASPDAPDPLYARKLQEVLGGQYGEITVAMQYGFQAWNVKIPGKYRDLLYGIGSEEFGHVEMLAIMIAQLLQTAPATDTEAAVDADPVLAAVIGGTDVQHAIVAGAGARPVDTSTRTSPTAPPPRRAAGPPARPRTGTASSATTTARPPESRCRRR